MVNRKEHKRASLASVASKSIFLGESFKARMAGVDIFE
jgi:hypothetical protein